MMNILCRRATFQDSTPTWVSALVRIVQCRMSLKRELDSNRDEPEGGIGFQREMSLKRECRMLRMNDHPHEQSGTTDAGRDGRICDEPSASKLVRNGAEIRVRAHRRSVEGTEIRPPEQGAEGGNQGVSGEGHGTEPRADHALDPTVDSNQADRSDARSAAHFPAPLNRRRWRG